MARFEVTIEMKAIHHMAIEAETAYKAQEQGLLLLGSREPEELETTFAVERGAV